MKINHSLKVILLALAILIIVGWAENTDKFLLSAAEYAPASQTAQSRPMTPEHPAHTWGTDPGGIIYDSYYPPFLMYPYQHPKRPPHYYHPPYHAPIIVYPPYYEPETPWYKDEIPIPAGRIVVLVDPLHAEAFVNGLPLQRQNDLSYEAGLLKGEYEVEIKAQGYETYQRVLEIQGGEVKRLAIRLEKEPKE